MPQKKHSRKRDREAAAKSICFTRQIAWRSGSFDGRTQFTYYKWREDLDKENGRQCEISSR